MASSPPPGRGDRETPQVQDLWSSHPILGVVCLSFPVRLEQGPCTALVSNRGLNGMMGLQP